MDTHWVWCWRAKNGEHEYFVSFGLPPPNEWELELSKPSREEGSGVLSSVADTATELFISKGIVRILLRETSRLADIMLLRQ